MKLVAVRIKVASEVDAYAIFETINSKKADLTVSDLLKNFIFSNAHHVSEEQLETARKNWELMSNSLGQDIEISQYVRHLWISAYERSRDKDLYRKIKDCFKGKHEELFKFSDMLAKEAELYSSIIDPQENGCNKLTYELLSDINKLRIRQCYPLILAFLVKEISQKELQQILQKITSVSIRRSIVDKNPNEVESYYAISAKKVRVDGLCMLESILNGFDDYNPKDKEIKSYLEENLISENLAKFILFKYEISKSTGEKSIYNVTLEHILPRNPEKLSDWCLSKEEHKIYSNKLGNLTLVGRKFNSIMSNKKYADKVLELSKSEFYISKDVADKNKKWGKEEIEKREKEILDFFFLRWK
ncbi:MAG: HNH endonuclease family protein [Candidatus Pacebacteria bacterium]|nr:HNH endonuclease family protein [Candidatus Paceibacterota bacterium]